MQERDESLKIKTKTMSRSSSNSNGIQQNTNCSKRFSIHDAFEEETDEAIKVYGSTVVSTPMRAKTRADDVTISIHDPSK